MKHIIGLGNPGRKYAKTRHNLGWLVLDEMMGKNKWKESKKLPGFYFWLTDEIELIKPTTYMNNSGRAVLYVKKKHPKLKLEDLIIVHDDKDLDFGRLKVTKGSSSAGHKGVESIAEHLKSEDFVRLRIGVKNELVEKMPTDKFVLSKFNREEKRELDKIISRAVEAIEIIISQGYQEAMNQFN